MTRQPVTLQEAFSSTSALHPGPDPDREPTPFGETFELPQETADLIGYHLRAVEAAARELVRIEQRLPHKARRRLGKATRLLYQGHAVGQSVRS